MGRVAAAAVAAKGIPSLSRVDLLFSSRGSFAVPLSLSPTCPLLPLACSLSQCCPNLCQTISNASSANCFVKEQQRVVRKCKSQQVGTRESERANERKIVRLLLHLFFFLFSIKFPRSRRLSRRRRSCSRSWPLSFLCAILGTLSSPLAHKGKRAGR